MIKTKQWSVGSGSVTIQYDGQGDGNIIITSDANSLYEARNMQINVETTDGSNIQRTVTINQAGKPIDYVDLGLPSGLIVSDGNGGYKIGNETDYGAYFSWGNVEPHFSSNNSTFDGGYDWGNTNGSSPYKYSPGHSIPFTINDRNAAYAADSIYDAAHVCLGGAWRVPTQKELSELCNNTDSEWTTINGVKGRKFMKKSDHSVYIFLPAGGSGNNLSLDSRGVYGFYDSSSLASSTYRWCMSLGENVLNPKNNYNARYLGFSIRAVQ